jgi:secondary thiamine-phosphate synthase enzyme
MKRATIAVDGASKGNPGPAGIGIVISDESGNVLREISDFIGRATNNVAEYTALLRGLGEASEMGFEHAVVQTDSELLARQIGGRYRVRNKDILPLFDSALDLLGKFKTASVIHVVREKNKQADKLANQAIRRGTAAQPALLPEEVVEVPSTRESKMVQRLSVRTSQRAQLVDITRDVQEAVERSGVSDGVATVFVPHTTAGITINENADPDVVRDIVDMLERLVPRDGSYRHAEGNADSHVKASLMGHSVSILIEDGRLVLGTWQGIYFCEFDGPRNRQVYVRVG